LKGWWRRLMRILEQDRIRLPKRQLEPHDIRPGDRLHIGQELWRVSEARPPFGSRGGWFALMAEEASVPTARLYPPDASDGSRCPTWLLIKGGQRLEVPGEMIVSFPSGLAESYSKGRTHS